MALGRFDGGQSGEYNGAGLVAMLHTDVIQGCFFFETTPVDQ